MPTSTRVPAAVALVGPEEIGYADPAELPWQTLNRPIDEARPFKVLCIGAGVSGIYAGIRITKTMKNVELTIVDKNADFGGTWFENRYLGCACDIPAHCYQFSFEPNPNWSSFYAPAAEICQYWKGVAVKYGLQRYTQFNRRVVDATWDDKAGEWVVKVQSESANGLGIGQVDTIRVHAVLQAVGGLNNWKWPDSPGLHSFKGQLIHSASWDSKFDFTGKRVALIGSGSTAIQILPNLQRTTLHTDQYVRSSTWIGFPFGSEEMEGDANGQKEEADGNSAKSTFAPLGHRYSDAEKKCFVDDPGHLAQHRHKLMTSLNSLHDVTMQGSEMQSGAQATFWANMQAKLAARPHIAAFLKPNFPVGCRRLTPGPGYLESLVQDNVGFVTDGISQVCEDGIVDEKGNKRVYDVIVCATGFDTSYKPRFPLKGRDGVELETRWQTFPQTYCSVAVDGYPNYFIANGPNSAAGSGDLIIVLQTEVDYAVQCMEKLQSQGYKSMDVKPEARADFQQYSQTYFKKTVFGTKCRTWYKSGRSEGPVTALWPGSVLHAVKTLLQPRWEDFTFERLSSATHANRFAYLGNGYTQAEQTPGADTAWYVTVPNSEVVARNGQAMTAMVLNGGQTSPHDVTADAKPRQGANGRAEANSAL